jgi:site-specific recombinase XerD
MRLDHLPRLFISERNRPFTRQAVNHIVATAAARASASHHPRKTR